MKKVAFLTIFTFLLAASHSYGQSPKLQGFLAVFNLCDQNGANQASHWDACVGDQVHIINKSRYGYVNGQSALWPIGNLLVSGYYVISGPGIYFNIPASNWKYNEIYSFTAPAGQSHPSSGLGALNLTVTYYQSYPYSSGATSWPNTGWNIDKLYFHTHPQVNVYTTASPSTVCPGGSSTISVTSPAGASVLWSTGATTGATTVTQNYPGSYSVTVTSSQGCTATEYVTVNVHDDNLTVQDEYHVCGDNSVTICPPEANGSTQWYRNDGQSTLVYTGDCFQTNEPGNYTVIKSSPCFAMENFDVIGLSGQLNPLFSITTTHMGPYYNLRADAVQTSFPQNVPGVSFYWQVTDMTVNCSMNNYHKWWGGHYPTIANAFTNNFPEFSSTMANCQPDQNYNFHGRFEYGHQYRIMRGMWSDCDGWTQSTTVITVNLPPEEGEFNSPVVTYHLRDEISKSNDVIIDPTTGQIINSSTIAGESDDFMFEIYPNPTEGEFYLEFDSEQSAQVEITDLTGKVILSKTSEGSRFNLNIADQPKGIYLVKVVSNNQVRTKRIVKE